MPKKTTTTKKTTKKPRANAVTKEIDEVQKRIEALTGVKPRSRNAHHLGVRLRELEARAQAGEDVRVDTGAGSKTFSFSLSDAGADGMKDILKCENVDRSKLVRRALAFWAESNGYGAHAESIRGGA